MIDERIAIAKATAYYLEGENDKITKEGDVEIKPKLYAVMSGSPFVDGFLSSPSRRSACDRDSTDDTVKEQNTVCVRHWTVCCCIEGSELCIGRVKSPHL